MKIATHQYDSPVRRTQIVYRVIDIVQFDLTWTSKYDVAENIPWNSYISLARHIQNSIRNNVKEDENVTNQIRPWSEYL